ncbi:MAG TPA: hypothetical protein VHI71_10190 [Actinomycetota bacterium]|nr:hypothetical protein [Actinomycetota bacterium]
MRRLLLPAALVAIVALAAPAHAGRLEQASVSSRERPGNDMSFLPDVSADGRKVVFQTLADNLARKGKGHVLLRDVRKGTTRIVSRNSRGKLANKGAYWIRISPNGRFVAWCSMSTNLAKPDRFRELYPFEKMERFVDVFVRDLRRGITRRASTTHDGKMADDYSSNPHVANDGDVVFDSRAGNLVRRDRDRWPDTFLYDWARRSIRMVSVDRKGRPVPAATIATGFSGDSRVITFYGPPELFVGKDPADVPQTMLYRRGRGRITHLREPKGIGDEGSCTSHHAQEQLSRTGRFVVIGCWHRWSDPEQGTIYGANHLYRYDRHKRSFRQLTPLSLHESSASHVYGWEVDATGRYVSWCTDNTYSEHEKGYADFFVRDVRRRRPQRVVDHEWQSADGICSTALAAGGRSVVFATNYPLVAKDRNDDMDVYLSKAPFYPG